MGLVHQFSVDLRSVPRSPWHPSRRTPTNRVADGAGWRPWLRHSRSSLPSRSRSGRSSNSVGTLDTEAAEGDPHFLAEIIRKPVWLFGGLAQAAGWVLQAVALNEGSLIVVQSLCAMSLVFALPIGARLTDQHVGRRSIGGAVLTLVGIVVFIAVGQPQGGTTTPDSTAWWTAGIASLAAMVVLAVIARRRRGPVAAALFATAAGIAFAFQAAVTKVWVGDLGGGLSAVLTTWTTYALVVSAMAGFVLQQSALKTSFLAPAMAASNASTLVISVVLGLTVFEETLSNGSGHKGPALIGLALAVVGVGAARETNRQRRHCTGLRQRRTARRRRAAELRGSHPPDPALEPPSGARGRSVGHDHPIRVTLRVISVRTISVANGRWVVPPTEPQQRTDDDRARQPDGAEGGSRLQRFVAWIRWPRPTETDVLFRSRATGSAYLAGWGLTLTHLVFWLLLSLGVLHGHGGDDHGLVGVGDGHDHLHRPDHQHPPSCRSGESPPSPRGARRLVDGTLGSDRTSGVAAGALRGRVAVGPAQALTFPPTPMCSAQQRSGHTGSIDRPPRRPVASARRWASPRRDAPRTTRTSPPRTTRSSTIWTDDDRHAPCRSGPRCRRSRPW